MQVLFLRRFSWLRSSLKIFQIGADSPRFQGVIRIFHCLLGHFFYFTIANFLCILEYLHLALPCRQSTLGLCEVASNSLNRRSVFARQFSLNAHPYSNERNWNSKGPASFKNIPIKLAKPHLLVLSVAILLGIPLASYLTDTLNEFAIVFLLPSDS